MRYRVAPRAIPLLVAAAAETVGGQAAERGASRAVESVQAESRRHAVTWSLSEAEWTRYEDLMAGRRGLWTPDADPLLVLGAHARTDAERRRFAQAFVLAEHERVEGELAFERAVQAAWARLFPGQPRLAAPPRADRADRYALVVDRECADCRRTVRSYLERGAPVDFYVRGAADDGDLRAWASAMGVQAAEVLGGRATINHGDAGPAGRSPAAWERRGGRWSAVE